MIMKNPKIPEATIMRLSVYSRFLTKQDKKGVISISSGQIAEGTGGSSAQVRKDFAYFGEFGTRGVGYNVKDLNHNIMRILGLNKRWKVVIIGAGNLGSALVQYKGFRNRAFDVVGVFDNDPLKLGLYLGGLRILAPDMLEQTIKEQEAEIAIIAVPANHAQGVADILIQSKIKAILNFAPTVINVPFHIELRNVDLTVNLEVLTYNIKTSESNN